jgi:hypothetical protein
MHIGVAVCRASGLCAFPLQDCPLASSGLQLPCRRAEVRNRTDSKQQGVRDEEKQKQMQEQ